MTPPPTEQRLPWWQGVGSPGIGGYVLADLAAVATLAVLLPLTGGFESGVAAYVSVVLLVGFFALFYSIPLALVGIPIVHFACLRVRNQAVHVLAAGVVGVAVADVASALGTGDAESWAGGLYLGVATAIGRAAVIPLALARRPS
jgi:hypothetical protein